MDANSQRAMGPSNEGELHAQWRSGSRRAGAILYGRYCARLVSLGRKLGLCSADAQDLAHETLMDAMRSNYEQRPGATYWNWISCIACRKAAAIPFGKPRATMMPRRITTPWGAECRRRLLDSISRMPTSQRVVFERILLGHEPAEIAEELGQARTAVYVRLYRGRRWLTAHQS